MRKLALILILAALPVVAQPLAPPDLSAPPAEAQKHESGLVTKKLSDGKAGGGKLTDENMVRLRYTAWKSDGTLIQHVKSGQSVLMTAAKMLPGWAEAVKLMEVGETRRIWIPASLGAKKIKEGELFVFDTELLEVIERPVTPTDVAAPPADATVRPSGLAYKVLRPGTGTKNPTRRSHVVVHYSGWTTDGKMFDSSVLRGDPAQFGLSDVIAGWTEGLQLMVEGEKTRFWIPSRLAYGNDRTKPQGMLVFDVELISIR